MYNTPAYLNSSNEKSKFVLVKAEGFFDERKKRVYLGSAFNNEYLTFKEAKVYYFIVLGYSASLIATNLNLSKSTVCFHIENLKNKLQCNTKAELISKGMHTGLSYTIYRHFSKDFYSSFGIK